MLCRCQFWKDYLKISYAWQWNDLFFSIYLFRRNGSWKSCWRLDAMKSLRWISIPPVQASKQEIMLWIFISNLPHRLVLMNFNRNSRYNIEFIISLMAAANSSSRFWCLDLRHLCDKNRSYCTSDWIDNWPQYIAYWRRMFSTCIENNQHSLNVYY